MGEKSPKNIKNTCKTNIYKFRANSKKAQQVNSSPFKSAQVPGTYFSFHLHAVFGKRGWNKRSPPPLLRFVPLLDPPLQWPCFWNRGLPHKLTLKAHSVSRCCTRGESQDHTGKKACEESTLALKPRADSTRSPKERYQWPHEEDLCPPKFFKNKKYTQGKKHADFEDHLFEIFL